MLNLPHLYNGHNVIYHTVKFNPGNQVLCIEPGTARHKESAAVINTSLLSLSHGIRTSTSQDAVDKDVLQSVLLLSQFSVILILDNAVVP